MQTRSRIMCAAASAASRLRWSRLRCAGVLLLFRAMCGVPSVLQLLAHSVNPFSWLEWRVLRRTRVI